MFKIGDRVMVASDNDNENYDDFKNEVLVITHVATNKEDHPGYDEAIEGMGLYDFETESGEDVPFSLYDYEIEDA